MHHAVTAVKIIDSVLVFGMQISSMFRCRQNKNQPGKHFSLPGWFTKCILQPNLSKIKHYFAFFAKFGRFIAEVFRTGCNKLFTMRNYVLCLFLSFKYVLIVSKLLQFHHFYSMLLKSISVLLYSLRIDMCTCAEYNKARNREVQRKLKWELTPLTWKRKERDRWSNWNPHSVDRLSGVAEKQERRSPQIGCLTDIYYKLSRSWASKGVQR